MKKVAWIGLGVMGAPMAGHLQKAGYEVKAYSRSYEKLLPKAEEYGLIPCRTIREAVEDADAVLSMVGYPKDVEQVFLGEDGILANVRPGTLVIDMTTSSPALAERLYAAGKDKGIPVLDAPVSGGDSGARNAALSIMVGGDREAFEQALPLFNVMGKSVNLMGGAGCGQHTKACNQIAVAGATAAYTEAMVYAEKAGLDVNDMLRAIGGGAAGSWQIGNMAPRVVKGDFAPGFFIKHFVKDMRIIREEAEARELDLKMLSSVLALYEEMMEKGYEDLGTQALIKYYKTED